MSVETPRMKHIVKLDSEPWYFTLYEIDNLDWVVSFPYSPKPTVDALLTIILTAEEKELAKLDRQYLIEFSKKIQNDPKSFFDRSSDFNVSIEYRKQLDEN